MTRLTSWLSADVMHALGWALIHSLWQGLGVVALAMLAMAFCRRPSMRYLIGVAALAVMLAAPAATVLVLMRPPVSVLPILSKPAVPANRVAVTIPQLPAYPVVAGADRVIAAVAEAPSRMPNLLPWLVRAWLCGVAVFSLRFAGGFLLLEHRRRTQSGPPSARMLAICQELQRQLGLDRAIQYLECAWVEAPAVIGWLRPAMLLPVFALTGLSEEQFRAVIAHELAHIRRHDWLVNLFQVLVETLLFYHPAMWWLNRRIRAERELCCDEIAVALTGSRLEYARALAQMAEWKNVSLLAMAANRGPLSERILHVLGRRLDAGQRVAGLTGGMLFLCAALAAANLLFGIAYPVQMAQAKESVKVALVSSQAAVADLARKVVLSARDAAPPRVSPGQMGAAADGKADTLAVPPADLSRVLPNQSLATPKVVASNAPPATPVQLSPPGAGLNDQPAGAPITHDPSAGPAQAALSPPPSVMAAPMAGLSPAVTGTEPALACLLGLSHWLCQHDLFAMRAMMSFPRGVSNCADDRHPNAWPKQPAFDPRCPKGVLEAVDYLGRNARGDDVYRVQYSHSITTYVLQKPNPDGKVEEYWNVNIPSYIMAVASQNAHKVAMYRRPSERSDPSDRHAANASPAAPPSLDPNEPYKITTCNVPNGAGTCDLVTLASATAPGPGSGPRNRTELAMKCWLGLVEYRGCWKSVCGDYGAGPLERMDYLGRTAAGTDIYQVRYRYRATMAYGVVPDLKGKADEYLVKATDPYWVKREISAPAAPILIYARPEDAPPAGCIIDGAGGHQLNAVDSAPSLIQPATTP